MYATRNVYCSYIFSSSAIWLAGSSSSLPMLIGWSGSTQNKAGSNMKRKYPMDIKIKQNESES